MPSVKELEKMRGKAQVKHKGTARKLETAITQDAPNQRLITSLLAQLDNEMDVLVDCHVALVQQSQSSLEEPAHTNWMNLRQDEHDLVADRAKVILEMNDAEGAPLAPQINPDTCKEDLQMMNLTLTAQLAQLEASMVGEKTVEQHKQLTELAEQVKVTLNGDYRKKGAELRELLPEEVEDLKTQHDADMAVKIPHIERILVGLRAAKPGGPQLAPVGGAARGAAAAEGGGGEARLQAVGAHGGMAKSSIKMKPLDPPVFDGKARNYARYRQKFKEMIEDNFDAMVQLQYLEQGLPEKVRDRMSMVQKSPEQIWTQLDAMYNDPKVLVKEAVQDLHNLDKKKLGDNFIPKFAATLLDTETLLDAVGQGDYLRHPREVAFLQDMLPKEEAREFVKRCKNYVGNEFMQLKTFLKDRKDESESLSKFGTGSIEKSEVESKQCEYCGKRGHESNTCFKKRKDAAEGKGAETKSKASCWKCGELGHKSFDCEKTKDEKKKETQKSRKSNSEQSIASNHLRTAECGRCKNAETLELACAGCGRKGANLKHCLAHCAAYVQEGVEGKAAMVKKGGNCVICLHPKHSTDKCYDKENSKRVCGLDGCASHHHPTLHGARDSAVASCKVTSVPFARWNREDAKVYQRAVQYLDERNFSLSWQQERREQEIEEVKEKLGEPLPRDDIVLLILQEIPMLHGRGREETIVNSFFDPGSTCSLILSAFAEKHGLYGSPVTVTISTVNGQQTRETKLYVIELLTVSGARKLLRAFGVECISKYIPKVDLEQVKQDFSSEVQEKWEKVSKRPKGEVELLIGSEVAGYQPEKWESSNQLVVMKSLFGTGYTVYGQHDKMRVEKVQFSEEVQMIRQAGLKICYDVHKCRIDFAGVKDFFSGEEQGIEPPRRCRKCRGCADCSFRGLKHLEIEAMEYKMIEDGVKHNSELDRFEVEYAFIDDPAKLSDNIGQVIKIAEAEERKLIKEGLVEEFNEKFEEFIELGTLREISQMEMDQWTGPVHYVPIQHVLRPDSETTRLRLVINSSLRCPRTGLSLNDILAKGPNVLNDVWEMLVRFRENEKALVSDVTKAYHQMVTGLLEMHLRRVVWRNSQPGKKWKVYGFLSVTFGDRPAAALLEIVIRMTAQVHKAIDPRAAMKLERDMYVDDLASGGDSREVERFRGRENPDTLECEGTMPQIMRKGGMRFKAMLTSGEDNPEKLSKLGGGVLGVRWSCSEDLLHVDFPVNISRRRRGLVTGPNLTRETLAELKDVQLTLRMCLSVVNSVYDPLGIASPITIQLKVAMKKLFSAEYGLKWDSLLPPDLKEEWIDLFTEMVAAGSICYQRVLCAKNCAKILELAIFFDGSDMAYAAAVYAVFRIEKDSEAVDVRLVASKARVAPDWNKNTPRLELSGAVLSSRLAVKVVRALEDKPDRVWMIGDSETVLAS